MNEIKGENEEKNFLEDIEKIKEELQKSIKNLESIKEFKKDEMIKKDSINENFQSKKSIKLKRPKINVRIFLFIPVLQFLDIKSIIELSRLNHLFHSFIYSFYFYRYASQLKKYTNKEKPKNKLLKNKNQNISAFDINKNSQNQTQGEQNIIIDQTKKIYTSFMSAITGAINYINPTSIPTPVIKSEKNELDEIEKKIALHEKLIDGRIEQTKLYKEINDIQKEIELYINRQNNNKYIKEKNKINKIINVNKKEDYEKEYESLLKEINELENEYEEIKKDNERQNNIGIELENQINKINFLTNNIEQNNEKL